MRKTNKTLSALLAAIMLTGAMTSVAFAHDPFNNDLFTVEKEITFEDGYLPRSMESYNTLPNEDYSAAKIVKEAYNENGEKGITELTDFLSGEEFDKKQDEEVIEDITKDNKDKRTRGRPNEEGDSNEDNEGSEQTTK